MSEKVEGIILNEPGSHTLPDKIFNAIGKDIIGSYKWRIHYVEQFGEFQDLEDPYKIFSGKALIKRIEEEPEAQWIWAYFQAFPEDILDEEILKEPVIYLEEANFTDYFYMLPIHLASNKSILEIECEDGSNTIVRTANKTILDKLKKKYPKWESVEKWYRPNGTISYFPLELDEKFYFHDSAIECIKYDKSAKELEITITFCYWAQEWYKKSEKNPDGIAPLILKFHDVESYTGITGQCHLDIIKSEYKFIDESHEDEYWFGTIDNNLPDESPEHWKDLYIKARYVDVTMTPENIIPKMETSWEINRKGARYYLEGDYTNAFKCYKKAANMGLASAMSNLGYCYLYGRNIEPDTDTAIKYFEKAAKCRETDAIYKLADIYSSDKWGKKDREKALKYLHEAANQIDGKSLERFGIHNCWRAYENYPSLCLLIANYLLCDEELEDYETARQFLICAKNGYEYQIEHGAEFYKESLKETKKLLNSDKLNPMRKRIREVKSIYDFRQIMSELIGERIGTDPNDDFTSNKTWDNEILLLNKDKAMTYEYFENYAGLAELAYFSEIFTELDEKIEAKKLAGIVKRQLKEQAEKEVKFYDEWYKNHK